MLDLDKNDLMEQIRNQLKPEMTTLFFNTYIEPLEIESIDNTNVVIKIIINHLRLSLFIFSSN